MLLYDTLVEGVGARMQLAAAMGMDKPGDSWFAANGMRLTFEHAMVPGHRGLLEIGTPECESPEALALRLVSIDALLQEVLPDVSARLAVKGMEGRLHLLKSNRDADGERFGRQDNRSIPLPTGLSRWLYRLVLLGPGLALAASLPAMVSVFVVLSLVASLGFMVWVFGSTSLTFLVAAFRGEPVADPFDTERYEYLGAMMTTLLEPFLWLNHVVTTVCALTSRTLYRDVEGPMQGFVISRAALTGSGHVTEAGDLVLSGKVDATTDWWPCWWRVGGHAVWLGHHIPRGFVAKWPRTAWVGFRDAFVGPVRLQLGAVDSNRAPFAEALSLVSLARVVDLAVAGGLDDAPRFADPLACMKTLNADTTLCATVTDVAGRAWSALELQRFYQQRAAAEHPDDPWMTAWSEAIEGVSTDPVAWVGRVDWVTKRYLLNQVASGASWEVQKRVDLGYHELGGLYDRLVGALDVPSLWPSEEISAAMVQPPSGPAGRRGALIREHGDALAGVSWTQVRLPDRVVWLHDR